jgi:DNA-binding NtrC family response regulator
MNGTILAVDDDPDVLRLVEAILCRTGFEVIVAAGGQQALEIFRTMEPAPDLLLTDVVMPEMSGPALVEELRALAPELRVLFMSGFDSRQLTQPYVRQGFPLLPKPFTIEHLATKVREVLAAPPPRTAGNA